MPEPTDPRDPLAAQLRAWADAADPVTPAEVRRRATGLDGRRRPPTRTLLLAAAVLALVAGVVGVTVLRDDDTTTVESTNDPATSSSTTGASGPTTTTMPVTTTTAPSTTSTTVATPSAGGEQEQWVGVDDQHRLVVVDTATGEVLRVLVTFDDPDAFGDDGEEPVAGGNFAGPIDVSPDGQTVFYETCCEPAVGLVFRVPITGGEPEQVAMGTNPAVSPDGTKLAVVALQSLVVFDLATGEETSYPGEANEPIGQDQHTLAALRDPAWSPDGTAIAVERYVDDLDHGEVVVVELDGGEDALLAGSVRAATDDRGSPMHPTWIDDLTLTYVRQGAGDGFAPTAPASSEVVDRTAGEPTPGVALWGPVLDVDVDHGGTRLITTYADGRVVSSDVPTVLDDGGEDVVLSGDGHFTGAAW